MLNLLYSSDYPSVLLDHPYSRVKEEPISNEVYTTSRSSFEATLTNITNEIEKNKIVPLQGPSKSSESQNRVDPSVETVTVDLKRGLEAYSNQNGSATVATSEMQSSTSKTIRKRRRGSKHSALYSEHNYTRSYLSKHASESPRASKKDDSADSVEANDSPKQRKNRRGKSATSPDNLRRSPRISRSKSDNQEEYTEHIKQEMESNEEFDWRDHVLEVRKKSARDQQKQPKLMLTNPPTAVEDELNLKRVKHSTTEKKMEAKVGLHNKQRIVTGGILIPVTNSTNPIIVGQYPLLHKSLLNETEATSSLTSKVGSKPPAHNKLLGKIVKIKCKTSSSKYIKRKQKIEPLTLSIIPTLKPVSDFPQAPDPLFAEKANLITPYQIAPKNLKGNPEGNKFIEIKDKDNTLVKTLEVHKIGPFPKKPSRGLRVKTQDELNASTGLLINADQTLGTSPSSNTSSCFPGSSHVNPNSSGALQKPAKLTTFPIMRPLNPSEASTSGTHSTGNKSTMVMSNDNGKTVRKFVLPINRVFERIPDSLREILETKTNAAQSQTQSEQNTPLGNPESQSVGKISKDVSGKKIKNMGRTLAKIVVSPATLGKEETSVKSRGIEPQQVSRSNQNTVVDMEVHIPSYSVPISTIDSNLTASNRLPKSFSSKNDDGVIVLDSDDESPNVTNPLKETSHSTKLYSTQRSSQRHQYRGKSKDEGFDRNGLNTQAEANSESHSNSAPVMKAIHDNPRNGKKSTVFQSGLNKRVAEKDGGDSIQANSSNNFAVITNISKLPAIDENPHQKGSFSEKKIKKTIIISLAKPNKSLVESSAKKLKQNTISLSLNPNKFKNQRGNIPSSSSNNPSNSFKDQGQGQTKQMDARSLNSSKRKELHVLGESSDDSDELPLIRIQDLDTFLKSDGRNRPALNPVQKDSVTDNNDKAVDRKENYVKKEGNIHSESVDNPTENPQAQAIEGIASTSTNLAQIEMSETECVKDKAPIEGKLEPIESKKRKNMKTSEIGGAIRKEVSDDAHITDLRPFLDSNRRRSERLGRRSSGSRSSISGNVTELKDDGVIEDIKYEDESVPVPKKIEETDILQLLFTSNQNYCGICEKEYQSLSSHLQLVHFNGEDAKEFVNMSKGSNARRNILRRWYFIGNLVAIIEAKPGWESKICSLCLNRFTGFGSLSSHYFRCQAFGRVNWKENIELISEERVNADLDRLTAEIRDKFDLEVWTNLEKTVLVSLYLLNDGLPTVDKLWISDYGRRKSLNVEKDQLLVEMIGKLPTTENYGQLKLIPQSNVLAMPLFLSPKQEEAINLLMIYAGPQHHCRKHLFTPTISKNRIGLTRALEYYGGKLVIEKTFPAIDENPHPEKKRLKRGKVRYTRIKGRHHYKKRRHSEAISDVKVELSEAEPAEIELKTTGDEEKNVDNTNSIGNIEFILRPVRVVLTRCDFGTCGEYSFDTSGNIDKDTDSRPISRSSDSSSSTTVSSISRNKSGNLKKKRRSSENAKTKRICKNNDFYRSFYLRSRKKSSTNKPMKLLIDSRDILLCKRCRKYYLRQCYLKHIKRCSVKIPRESTKRKLASYKSYGKGPEDKHRVRVSTCPTLQSAAGVKKYFCIFCKQTFTKLNRHLEHKHKDEEEVREMLKYPKRSTERKQILYELRTRGTFTFNKNSEYNGGKIIVSRRPHPMLQRTSRDFLPCPSCGNYFAKKTLYRHSKRCSKKEGLQKDLRRRALALIARVHPKCNKIMANLIIPRLVDDNVSEAIKNDELLILFGNHLTRKHHTSNIGKGYIRQNLRIVGKFFLAMKNLNQSIEEFSSIYNPKYCDAVSKALIHVAGYNLETKTFKLPEIARKLGKIVKTCGEVWSMECSKRKKFEDRRMVMEFLHRFEEIYKNDVLTKLIPRPSIKVQTNELKKMFQFSQTRMIEAAERLKKDFSYDVWLDLANSLLVHLRLLNNNIVQDGASLYVSDYLQRHSIDFEEDSTFYHTLELLSNFPRNYLKVKLGTSSSWLLLSQEFCSAVDVLLENREDAGVPIENVYVFGLPEQKDQHFKSRDAKNYLRVKASNQIQPEAKEKVEEKIVVVEEKVKQQNSSDELKSSNTTYANNLRKAFDHHSSRMIELTTELRQKFSNQVWIELIKCVLTCVQLMNDTTFAEVVQYLLLIDYNQRQVVPVDEDITVYNSLVNLSGSFYKLKMKETPITLLLSSMICEALDLLIEKRSLANIDPDNPYVFGCSGNRYNYYRTEGCIGSLPVNDGVEEILTLRCKIINDLIKNGSAGLQLWKFLPESKEDMKDNAIRVFYYSQSKMVELKYKLEEKFCPEVWLELVRCLLTYLHLLNNRCPEDAEKTLIADVSSGKREHLEFDEDKAKYHCLDDLSDFPQNYLKARVGQGENFLLLSLDFCATLDVLLAHRQGAGVHVDNPYVFGCRGNKENYFRAHGAIAHVATKCGVKRLKYDRAKRVNGKVEIQEQIVDVKDISRAEREILLNDWKIERMMKAADQKLIVQTKKRESNPIPRRRWTDGEMACAARNFTNCLTKGYLPSIYQCQQVIADNAELSGRTPEQLKAWVNNQIQKQTRKQRGQEVNVQSTSAVRNVAADSPTGSKRAPRVRWSEAAQSLVRLYFADNLLSKTLPSAGECRKVIAQHSELSNRTPEQLRAWVNNKNKKAKAK
ncbi:hypothetical protein Trydic_g2818 [Trypoxylus dichotomus]